MAAPETVAPFVQPTRSASVETATLSQVNSTASSTQILAANSLRKGVVIYNTDAADLYIKYGTTASTSSFTAVVYSGVAWEMPNPIYNGRIDGIWASDGSGLAAITELT